MSPVCYLLAEYTSEVLKTQWSRVIKIVIKPLHHCHYILMCLLTDIDHRRIQSMSQLVHLWFLEIYSLPIRFSKLVYKKVIWFFLFFLPGCWLPLPFFLAKSSFILLPSFSLEFILHLNGCTGFPWYSIMVWGIIPSPIVIGSVTTRRLQWRPPPNFFPAPPTLIIVLWWWVTTLVLHIALLLPMMTMCLLFSMPILFWGWFRVFFHSWVVPLPFFQSLTSMSLRPDILLWQWERIYIWGTRGWHVCTADVWATEEEVSMTRASAVGRESVFSCSTLFFIPLNGGDLCAFFFVFMTTGACARTLSAEHCAFCFAVTFMFFILLHFQGMKVSFSYTMLWGHLLY